LETIHRALDAGSDPRSLARQIVDYLRGLMLIQLGNGDQVEVTREFREKMSQHARSFSTPEVLRMMKSFNSAAVDARSGWQPSLGLELALAEAMETPAEVPVSNPGSKSNPPRSGGSQAGRSVKAESIAGSKPAEPTPSQA